MRLISLFAASMAFVLAAPILSAADPAPRTNVLLIYVDDLRNELPFYGKPIAKAPNMDALAQSGSVFDRAYCQVAVCGASRASTMSGILPTYTRFVGYTARIDQDYPSAITLPENLKNAGYTTISLGKIFHFKEDTNERSWSVPAWVPEWKATTPRSEEGKKYVTTETPRGPWFDAADVPDEEYWDGQVAVRAEDALSRLKQEGNPFFLAVGFIKPHLPFYAPQKYWDLYDPATLELAANRYTPHGAPEVLQGSGEIHSYNKRDIEYNSDEWHRTALHGYLACVSYTDAMIGRVLARLESEGLADNTVVVLIGDHGWHLGEHNFWGKHNTLHNAIRVPMVWRVPGTKMPQRVSELSGLIDIYPTICELTGVEAPRNQLQGRSLVPLLQGKHPADWRESIYSRYVGGDCVTTNQFTYTRFTAKDGSPNGEMFFDLFNDREENWNLLEAPTYGAQVARHRKLLDAWISTAESK